MIRMLPISLLVLALLASPSFAGSDIDRALRDEYEGKTLLLREFYSGDNLLYDSAGTLIGEKTSGDWTTDGFVTITGVQTLGSRFVIQARRLFVVSMEKGFDLRPAERRISGQKNLVPVNVKVEVDFGTDDPTVDGVRIVVQKIFLTDRDRLAELVPDYWKPCVPEGLSGQNHDCRFSGEIQAVPGVSSSDQTQALPAATTVPALTENQPTVVVLLGKNVAPPNAASLNTPMLPSHRGAFHVGGGVSPPRIVLSPEPEFSEDARAAKYHGTAVLSMIVTTEGKVDDVRIVRPLGAGLDIKAVRAVEGWRFEPGMKDGQPVPVEVSVEVDFHLY